MALVRIEDVIVPEQFDAYMLKETAETADVIQSGIVVPSPGLSAKLALGGEMFQSPVWNDLGDDNEAEIASDNPAEVIVPDKLTAYKMLARRQVRTKAWSTADLTDILAGDNPMQRIVSRVGAWWGRAFNRYAIATLNGVINANVANNDGDMVYVAGVGTGGSTTPTADLDATVILNAKQTMGDKSEAIKLIMMHSVVFTNLQTQQLITFIPSARAEVMIPTYLGYRVLVSDNLPKVSLGGGNYAYTTYLCAPGILGFGEHSPAIPVEVERAPGQGNGMGVEILHTRRQFAMQPLGHHWTENTCVKQFPSNAELELAANWQRKFPERKQVPFTAVISLNG